MAQEVIINVKTNGGEESLKSINDLKNAISKLEEESNNMDLGSEAFEDAKNNIDELKKKLEGLSKSQKKIDEEIGKSAEEAHAKRAERMEKVGNNLQKFAAGLADAFAGAFIAMGAGEEDAKRMNETLQQGVGIAIGAKGAIEALVAGVELAGPAFEALNAIMAANPIGTVVVAVAALAAGIYLLIKAFEDEEVQSDAVNKALDRNAKAHQDNEVIMKKIALEKQLRDKTITQEAYNAAMAEFDLSKKRVQIAGETSKDIVQLYKDYGYEVGQELKLRQKREDYYTREGILVRDNAWYQEKEKLDKFNKELANLRKASKDRFIEEIKVSNAKVAEENDKHNKEESDKQNQNNKKSLEDKKKADKELNDYLQNQLKDSRDLKFANDKFMAEEGLKINTELNTNITKALQTQVESERKVLTDGEIETQRVLKAIRQQRFQEGVAEVNKYTQAIGSALNSVVGVFSAISDLRSQEQEQDTKERQEKLDADLSSLSDAKDAELAKADLTEQQKADINNKYAEIEYNMKLDEYNRETEIKKKAFEQDKKLKIAQTVISTITGAVSAFVGMVQSIPGPAGLILGAISAAAVTAMGAINIAAIQKQKFDAGSAPQAPKMQVAGASTGSSGGGGAQSGPQLYGIGGGDINTGSGGPTGRRGVNGGSGNSNQPIKAYVVSQEVTSSQNIDAVIKRRSSF